MTPEKLYDKHKLLHIDNWTVSYKNDTNTFHTVSRMRIWKYIIVVSPIYKIELTLIGLEFGYQNFDNPLAPMHDYNIIGSLYKQIGSEELVNYEIVKSDQSRYDNMSNALIDALRIADDMITLVHDCTEGV